MAVIGLEKSRRPIERTLCSTFIIFPFSAIEQRMPYKVGGGGLQQYYDVDTGQYGCGYDSCFSLIIKATAPTSKIKKSHEEIRRKKMVLHLKRWLSHYLERSEKKDKKSLSTICVIYDKSKKRYFYGRNKGISLKKDAIHPNLLEGTPSPRSIAATLYFNYDIYNCAEIDALNQALHSGSKMANLEVYTTHYGGKKHLMPKPSCPLCTMLLRGEIAANYSGWQEREFPHE